MLKDFCEVSHIYIACGYTDLRRGIDGLEYTNGIFHGILHGIFHQYSIEIMKKKVMGKYVYSNVSILKLELVIINSLLDKFVPAVLEYEEDNENYKQLKGDEN